MRKVEDSDCIRVSFHVEVVAILGQSITTRDMFGGILIIIVTTIVVADNSVDRLLLHVRKIFPKWRKR